MLSMDVARTSATAPGPVQPEESAMNSNGTRRGVRFALFATLLTSFATALLAPPPVQARITGIVIDAANSQNPTYGGTVFPESGATYEKITGRAHGEVDPADPLNALITDIALAPKDPVTGNVKYSVD